MVYSLPSRQCPLWIEVACRVLSAKALEDEGTSEQATSEQENGDPGHSVPGVPAWETSQIALPGRFPFAVSQFHGLDFRDTRVGEVQPTVGEIVTFFSDGVFGLFLVDFGIFYRLRALVNAICEPVPAGNRAEAEFSPI